MKKITCLIVCVSFLFVATVQAAEVPFMELTGHTNTVYSAAFSPDGQKIVTARDDVRLPEKTFSCRLRDPHSPALPAFTHPLSNRFPPIVG